MDRHDKRYQMTHEKILQNFMELWKEKPYYEISVTELTRKSQINRSSFYLHFDSLKAVKEELENDVLVELQKITNRYPAPDNRLPDEVVFSYYLEVGLLCSKYESLMLILPKKYGDMEFYRIFGEVMIKKTFHLMIKSLGEDCNEEAAEDCRCLSYSFVAGWKSVLMYCTRNNNPDKFVSMVKAIDGDVQNNLDRIRNGKFL